MISESPYRAAVAQTELKADSALGPVSLRVAPRHTQLLLGSQVWTFADQHMTVVSQGRARTKKKSVLLKDVHLYVARAWPTHEFSVWIERKAGVVQRLLGLRAVPGFSQETFQQTQALERLATRLQTCLGDYAQGASAFELGQGQHRVLCLVYADRMVLYARPLFRERPRKLIELGRDHKLTLARRRGDRVVSMSAGVEIVATGDRIQFCHPDGEIAASIFLPWIGEEARVELTRRFKRLVSPTEHASRRAGRDSELSLNKQLRVLSRGL